MLDYAEVLLYRYACAYVVVETRPLVHGICHPLVNEILKAA